MTGKHPFLVWADRVAAGESLDIVPPQHRALIAWALEQRRIQAVGTGFKPEFIESRQGNPGIPNALKGRKWTRARIVAAVRQQTKALGRLPRRRELRSPTWGTILRHFGTLSACFAAARIS